MANERKAYELVAQPRELIGKQSKQLRRQHIIPATVYGHAVNAESIQLDQKELERVYHHAGSNALIDLKVGDGAAPRKVFIHNVQRDPVSRVLSHVDFMVVNLREEMTTTVPIVLVGEAPAAENKEGMLLQALDHIQVKALPADIPSLVEADISGLDEVDKAIHVSDLVIPANVTVLTGEDELVAKITALRVEEEVEVEEEEREEGAIEEADEAAAQAAEGAEQS